MPKKLLVILLVAISLFSFTIFVVMPVSASNFTNISAAASPPNTSHNQISVDETFNGTTVGLSFGDNLIINLQSNPSTGFMWQLDQSTPACCKKSAISLYPHLHHYQGVVEPKSGSFRQLEQGLRPSLWNIASHFLGELKRLGRSI
jgi:hypothetical protein